jgi:Tol biopolymer transport system component/predicted Ser/Thr protein kinase
MQPDDDRTKAVTLLSKGTVINHYRIVEKIGAGGMGEVYLAEDTKLNRKVALKFLSPHLCQDEACRQRFEREAQAAAKLNHPHIVTIYEVSEFNGRPFFAMEHIEGTSLAEYIKAGDHSIPKIIELSVQICDGLSKAHQAGIFHRDIKPSNILIDKDGRAKILDFGLAAIKGADKLTKTGSTLGTLHYMSPEQVRGGTVDERSDIFSLGVVLYEMITGQLPFKGDYEPAIIYSIQYEEPEPLARYKSRVTPELQRIVCKALAKDTALRYQHSDDLGADLRGFREGVSSRRLSAVTDTQVAGKRRWLLRLIGPILALIIVAAALYFGVLKPKRLPHIAAQRQVTFLGDLKACDLSPDGSYIALVRRGADGDRVLVQNLGEGEPLELAKFFNVNFLHWSPSGTELLVAAWTGPDKFELLIIPRFGGTLQAHIPRSVRCSEFASGDWSPDGSRIVYHSGLPGLPILVINRQSGDSTALNIGSDSGWVKNLSWSPRGDRILYRVQTPTSNRFWTARVDGTNLTELTGVSGAAPHWDARGNGIYFLMARNGSGSLMKLRIDPATGERTGEPEELIAGLKTSGPISISEMGQKLLYPQTQSYANLWLADRGDRGKGRIGTTSQITQGTAGTYAPSISPDGLQVVYTVAAQGEQHVYTMPLSGGEQRRLTNTTKSNISPAWSPDGKQVAFVCWSQGGYRVAVMDSDGSRVHIFEKSLVSEAAITCAWSPSQKIIYERPGNRNFALLDPQSESERFLVTNDSAGWMFEPHFAPDGNKVAIHWNRFLNRPGDRAGNGVWVVSLTEPSQTFAYRYSQMFTSTCLGWSPDGEWIYVTNTDSTGRLLVCRVSEREGIVDTVCLLPLRDVAQVSMTPDCNRFVCVVQERISDLWLIEHFDPEAE